MTSDAPIKSVMLVPYCPIPPDTGGKREMWQCMQVLRTIGPCRILSAAHRPVGVGWEPTHITAVQDAGFEVVLRETDLPVPTLPMALGWLWGAVFKALHLEKAFGHANPYHRWAFPTDWWQRHTADADIVVIAYSYWAHLPTPCPKALLLLDLWSNTTWANRKREAMEINACEVTFVISKDEETLLHARGVRNLHWSPPSVPRSNLPSTASCALVGSDNRFNVEGLRWLESAGEQLNGTEIRIYGALATAARHPALTRIGRYNDSDEPYRDNSILLFTTVQGMGVQIKTIEALAAGRAIVARRGSVRGLPPNEDSWIEVDTPAEATAWIRRLKDNEKERLHWSAKAHAYYNRHLDADTIREQMRQIYRRLARQRAFPSRPKP